MGRGDQLMGTGMARGAKARGKRVAFGHPRRGIVWDRFSAEIFMLNPNIACLGSERDDDLEWIPFYSGHRLYNRMSARKNRWIWNMEFRPTPGEFYFSEQERAWADSLPPGYIVVEPNVEARKSWSVNKDWPEYRYNEVIRELSKDWEIVQFAYGAPRLAAGVRLVSPPSFRSAAAALARAALYFGPEGGMHHAAAAVGIPAVVIFGGFIPPEVTGYDFHTNLTGKSGEACGSLRACAHCRRALLSITPEEVTDAVRKRLYVAEAAE